MVTADCFYNYLFFVMGSLILSVLQLLLADAADFPRVGETAGVDLVQQCVGGGVVGDDMFVIDPSLW